MKKTVASNVQSYIDEISEEIIQLEKQSERNRKQYLFARTTQITSGVIITLSTGFMSQIGLPLELSVGLLGAVIAALYAVLELFKCKDNWLECQNTAELLKSEKRLFATKTAPYNKQNDLCVLVKRVESIRSRHSKTWNNFMSIADDHQGHTDHVNEIGATDNTSGKMVVIKPGNKVKQKKTA